MNARQVNEIISAIRRARAFLLLVDAPGDTGIVKIDDDLQAAHELLEFELSKLPVVIVPIKKRAPRKPRIKKPSNKGSEK
jgi:hypothetical protein